MSRSTEALFSRKTRSTIVLRKFLRARDFKVADAAEMLTKTLAWREENKVRERGRVAR